MEKILKEFFDKNTTYNVNKIFYTKDPEVDNVYLVWIDSAVRNNDISKHFEKYIKQSRLLYGHALIVYLKENDLEEINLCSSLLKYRTDATEYFITSPLEQIVVQLLKGKVSDYPIDKVIIEPVKNEEGDYIVWIEAKFYDNTYKTNMNSTYSKLKYAHCWYCNEYEISKIDPYQAILDYESINAKKYFLNEKIIKKFKDFLD